MKYLLLSVGIGLIFLAVERRWEKRCPNCNCECYDMGDERENE